MDPFTAIGVASGILTFITFSMKVVKTGQGIYISINSREEENLSRENIIAAMRAFTNKVPPASDPQLAQEDENLRRLIEECHIIAQQLLDILNKIKPKNGESALANMRAAIRHVASQAEMKDLERRLDQCRGQLELLLNSRYFHQTMSSLDQLLFQTKEDASKLAQLQANIDQLHQGAVIGSFGEKAQDQLRRLIGIQEEALNIAYQDRLLQSLRFTDMRGRYETLDPAHEKTFRWLLEEDDPQAFHEQNHEANHDETMRSLSRTKFLNWLSSSGDIFHISGKLGSGKSTLMKYLYQHQRTKTELENWAGNKRLVFASFFFWKPGSALQKSFAGLCRSLLHDVLQACPELMPYVLPELWEALRRRPLHLQSELEVSEMEIQSAFIQLIKDKKVYAKHKFCLFIDGLDEYEQTARQDHKAMVDLLCTCVENSSGNMKLCVSSREYNVFMNAFSDDHRLRVHELTLPDMRGYVQDRLDDLPNGEAKDSLIVDVADRAEGIFLWVALVVQSMRDRIEDGEEVEELRDLLDSLPLGLEELFHHILSNLGERKRTKAYQTFAMLSALKSDERFPPLSLLAYSFYDQYNKDKKFALQENLFDTTPKEKRIEFAQRQLRGNCGGLLESGPHTNRIPGGKIDYTHRSVPEYLETLHDQKDIKSANHGFSAVDAASSLILAQVRVQDCLDSETSVPICAGLAYLRLMNNIDEEPFDFLECLDSQVDESNWRQMDVAEVIGICFSYLHQHVINHHFAHEGPAETVRIVYVYNSLLTALSIGYNEYVTWKISNDPRAVNSPIKRMVMAHVALYSRRSGLGLPLDYLFSHGIFSDKVLQRFFAPVTPFLNAKPWDLPQSMWLSVWHQYLVNEFLEWCDNLFDRPGFESHKTVESHFGHVTEQFLDRNAADIHFEAFVKTRGTGPGSSEIVKVIFQFKESSSQLSINLDNSRKQRPRPKPPSWLLRVAGENQSIQNSEQDIHVSLRQFIEVVSPNNKERLLFLLDKVAGQTESAGPVEAEQENPADTPSVSPGTPGLEPPPAPERQAEESIEAKSKESMVSAFYFLEKIDTQFVLAFGSGMLFSFALASIWMRYSAGGKGAS